jgi:aldose 1-epimerase
VRISTILALAAALMVTAACTKKEAGAKGSVTKQAFGKTSAGEAVDLYTLKNKNGVEVSIMNYGAIVVSLKTPDAKGQLADIVLGFDKLDGYLAPKANSRSTGRNTRSRKIMAKIRCTAG